MGHILCAIGSLFLSLKVGFFPPNSLRVLGEPGAEERRVNNMTLETEELTPCTLFSSP